MHADPISATAWLRRAAPARLARSDLPRIDAPIAEGLGESRKGAGGELGRRDLEVTGAPAAALRIA